MKKLSILTLALALAAMVLTGCEGGNVSNRNDGTVNGTNSTSIPPMTTPGTQNTTPSTHATESTRETTHATESTRETHDTTGATGQTTASTETTGTR